MKLLCLPCAGSSAAMYWGWQKLTPDWLQVVPIELAGRGSRMAEPYITKFDDQISDLQQRYAKLLTGQYVLFGHSMGSLLSYALCAALHKKSQPLPKALVLSAFGAPSLYQRRDGKLDDAALIADLKAFNGTPQAVFDHPQLLKMTLDTLRADYQLCGDFDYQPLAEPLPIPIHVLAGQKDVIGYDNLMQWQQQTALPITLDWFAGDHFYLGREQNEKQMLTVLCERLMSYRA